MTRNYFNTLLLEERTRINLWLTVAAVFFVWTAATLYVVYHLRSAEDAEARNDFDTRTGQVAAQVQERLRTYAEVLRGGAGLFRAARNVDQSAWHAYVDALDLDVEYPGILGVGYAPRVRRGELAAHEAALHREGMVQYRVRPPGARDEYTPVTYIEPFIGDNLRAFGYDMWSESSRRVAMELARDSDQVTLTSPLRLLQGSAQSGQPGFLMYKAWYRPGTAFESPSDTLRGYVFAPFRTAEFMAPIARGLRHDMLLTIVDRQVADPVAAHIYASGAGEGGGESRYTIERELSFGGRVWGLQFRSLPDLEAQVDHRRSELVSIAGLIVGVLLSILIGHVTRRRELAEASARSMTADLRASEARFRILTELSSDWYWEQGRDLRFINVSRGKHSRSLNPDHIVGRLPWEMKYVWTDEARDRFRLHLEAHLPVRDFEVEVAASAGSYWIVINSEPQFDETGDFIGYRGTAREITDRKRAEAELRHHTEHLQELVAERTAGLESAKDAAEQAYRAKSEFLANMSHELRTPLHAILSFARLGVGRSADPALGKLNGYFNNILLAGERLLGLVTDLLDLAKIEAGRMSMNRSDGDLVGLARSVAEEFSAMAEERGISVVAPLAGERAPIMIDSVRMGQVLRNLVSNALKFSPKGARIDIVVAAADMPAGRRVADRDVRVPAWSLKVMDTGIGIPENELSVVFDKFVQSSKTNTGAGGTGLGLAICREIVEAHRGTIEAANRPGGGAVFEILLPR